MTASNAVPPAHSKLVIAGIGGSAGSIPAFQSFFRNAPADAGIAYVVILHLAPEYESQLAEILQGSTAMPVTQVRERVKVEPDHVYVIPPNKSLTMTDGVLVVSDLSGFEERRAPVDIFFRALADNHDASAVCVILSGSGSDGSMGLRRIKEYNGLVLVQDPDEAEFDEMPRSSIATGLVDLVLPVAKMPQRIIEYRDRLRDLPLPAEEPNEADEHALMEIFTTLRLRTGHDFTNYKRATVLRRIERRLAVREMKNMQEYAALLRDRPDEAEALMRELLISVTNFFRDAAVWQRLEETVIPDLLRGKGAEDHVRVWVAGCASGEEAYSIAMALADAVSEAVAPPEVQIFATDLDEDAIAKARNASYSLVDIADVPPERLRRYFVKEDQEYRIRRELRETVLFAHHNLIKDPPFSHVDLISCRNLLIYLNRTAQERTMEVLHFALEPEGYLLLGTAETVDSAASLFSTFDKETHIYRSRAVPRVLAPRAGHLTIASDLRVARATAPEPRQQPSHARFGALEVHQRLLEEYAPPSLIVDEQHNIVHLSERAGKYLRFAVGEASLNVLSVAKPELRIALRTALFQAAQRQSTVTTRVGGGADAAEPINIVVHPMLEPNDPGAGYLLVVFEEGRDSRAIETQTPAALETSDRQMEEEVIRLRGQMRGTVEQYEIQAEEAKAANEELQAINEELRSTAEELETSQEELQSLNEELQTVNQELKVKIEEISHANNDMRNLMSSTEIGTIFVDRSLRVELFTPRIRDIFNLIPADVGRPLLDIASKLRIDNLASDVDAVLDRLQTIEREVETRDEHWHLMRMLPYRTADDHIDGVVLTFLDITHRKRAEDALRLSEEKNRAIVEGARDYAILTIDLDGRIVSWSPGAEAVFGWTEPEALGQPFDVLFTPEDREADIPARERRTALARGVAADVRWHLRKSGLRIYIDGTLRTLADASGNPSGFVKIGYDVTQRRTTEEAVRDSEARLQAIANVVPDLLWSTDPSGSADWFNRRWLDYTGQTLGEARGSGWIDAIYTDDRAETVERFRLAVKSGDRLRHEHRICGTNREYRWFLIQAEPQRDSHGAAVRWFVAATDIHEQREARDVLEQSVRDRTIELEALSKQRQQLLEDLVTATEEERQRIARELHDELGQHVTALRVGLQAVQPGPGSMDRMNMIVQRLDETIDRLTLELRPPALDHFGLHGAITSLATHFSQSSGLRIDTHLPGVENQRFRDAIETAVYRAVQEALTNVWKHAQASTVSVIAERTRDMLRVIIEDNGKGFDADAVLEGNVARGRFGLLGMRERLALVNGSMSVEAHPGSGTAVYLSVPVAEKS